MSGALSFDKGARHACDALVGQLAAQTVTLRLPSPPIPGSNGEQLGMPSAEFHDIAISPALVRLQSRRTLVILSATALENALALSGEQEVLDALRAVSFVQIGDRLFTLDATERRTVYGRAYLYRLLLRDPATPRSATQGKGAA